ncbi:M16 family metallopeptidase [Alkalitalea saponilacus]|uniref:Predicted Zn-dependent peptidase n=1 Tax=Alkalitalea saponilacus TaxID=889453 RepID=A0A1T5CPF6_9BACT|nr:pitrilysin family protein [Alkalitalea saponilacus]ASB49934.1 peptidase M16 [Alkalitalea saponilacus]SKB61203.1 Predicted Zn-dependent peptidase [Alkalitalea saponilacus]
MHIKPDRSKGPAFETINQIGFLPVAGLSLPNGIEVSMITAGSQDVTKIDWMFPAGAVQAGKPLLASTVGNLLMEGTTSRTSQEISGMLDFYGAYLSTQTFYHNTVVTLICLTKELPDMLPLVEDIIKNPAFDKRETDIYINKRRQEYILDSEKVKTIAARRFPEVVFGANHPYGKTLKLSHFDELTRDELFEFHKNAYTPLGCRIIVSGQPGNEIGDLLVKYFGSSQWLPGTVNLNGVGEIEPLGQKVHLIEKEGALQSALRIGRPLFNNNHPDFIPLQIVNTILGGYFGSRLMTSVREEKGLTYGIGSNIVAYKNGGMWVIGSEVMGEMRQAAVGAIIDEMVRLTKEPVPENELEVVKNYMLGELMRNFDGPFSTSDIFRSLWEYDLDFTFYAKMVEEITKIDQQRIMQLSEKYLNPDDFYVVVAGK